MENEIEKIKARLDFLEKNSLSSVCTGSQISTQRVIDLIKEEQERLDFVNKLKGNYDR